ncbi:MAG: hypothetical protein ABIJ03_00715 [Patescibacteria group bacterium]|nr:hypothetical protein [Patescibacteria group bacterium]
MHQTLVPNQKLIKFNLAISLSMGVGLLIMFGRLQPTLPLFYSLPTKEASLIAKEWLAVIPGVSLLINGLHWLMTKHLSSRLNQPTIWQLFWQMTTLIQILLAMSFVRIIWITY